MNICELLLVTFEQFDQQTLLGADPGDSAAGKSHGRRGFGHNHQTGTSRIAQPRLQVVDFVTDMVQAATFLEEIADWRGIAGGLDQLIDGVAYVERSEKSDANPLDGIMRNLAIPLRRDGKRKFLSNR